MTGIKFDEEKIRNCVESYYHICGEYPYLICSEETMKIIPEEKKENYFTITQSYLSTTPIIGNNIVKEEQDKKILDTWYNAKIIIDNDLKYGEVLIK